MRRGPQPIKLHLRDMKYAHIKADDGKLAGTLQVDYRM
jgi:hypothetical protein